MLDMPTRPHKENEILKALGATIRASRKRLNMSQSELAELAGLHDTYIGDVELSGRNIAILNFLRLSVALKIPPDKLLKMALQQLKRMDRDFNLEEFFKGEEPKERRDPRKALKNRPRPKRS